MKCLRIYPTADGEQHFESSRNFRQAPGRFTPRPPCRKRLMWLEPGIALALLIAPGFLRRREDPKPAEL
jgi:hypothetical protein